MTATTAKPFSFNHSLLLLLLLLLHLFISVCHGRPAAASTHHRDVISDDDDVADDEPNVFAVFERTDSVSGKMTSTSTNFGLFSF